MRSSLFHRPGLKRAPSTVVPAFAVALTFISGAALADVESKEIHTEHYDLYIEGPGADELAAVVEPLYAKLKEFFGKEPDQRFRIKVFAGRNEFIGGAQSDHVDPIRRSFYSASTRTCYVLREGREIDDIRGTILHECVHQFHFVCCTGDRSPKSWFYREGLPTRFAIHRWTGERVILEAVPQIDDMDIGALALEDFETTHARSFVRLACDDRQPDETIDYAAAWGLVGFLIARHHDVYLKWAGELDHGGRRSGRGKMFRRGSTLGS